MDLRESNAESSESDSSVFYESSDSNDDNLPSTAGYAHEPEYTQAELKNMSSHDDDTSELSEGEDEDMDSSRLENLHWCKCKNRCIIQPTLVECKCCREFDKLLASKLTKVECISLHEEFKILCLNPTVLETAYILHRRRRGIFKEFDKMLNK